MSDVENELLRLKAQLGVSSDKALADLLGIGEKALNARKKRGKSLKDKVLELVANRPDLRIDADYVLHGKSGGYSVARTGQLAMVMAHFKWTPAELAVHLGLDQVDAAALREALGSSAGVRLRNTEMSRLVKEFRVRREYLVLGVEPMFGDPDDDLAALSLRVARLEEQLSSMANTLKDMVKSNAALQSALSRGETIRRTKPPARSPPGAS